MIYLKFIYLRLQSRFITWLFWTLIWVALGVIFALIFQSFSQSAQGMDKLYQSLPQALLKSVNIEPGYLTQVEKFLSGQFLTIYTLIGAVFALFQGVGEIGGKIDDRTISNFLTKNISRSSFYTLQFITNLIFLFASNVIVWLSIYWSFRLFTTTQNNISTDYFVYGSLSTSVLFVTICGIGQAWSTIVSKNIAQFSGIGILVISWFLNSLSSIDGYPDWLRPWAIFYYLNVDKLRDEFAADSYRLTVLVVVYLVSLVIGVVIFRKKDMYL
jgi:ABC-type transport system involved in multi-copper enzyme maturation permease subunit